MNILQINDAKAYIEKAIKNLEKADQIVTEGNSSGEFRHKLETAIVTLDLLLDYEDLKYDKLESSRELVDSGKLVKSGLDDRQRRQIDWNKLEFEVDFLSEHGYDDEEIAYRIFEENSIEELNDFGFDGDAFYVQQEIEDAIQELRKNNINSSCQIKSSEQYGHNDDEYESIVDEYMDKWLETKDNVTNEEIKQHRKHLEKWIREIQKRSVQSSHKNIKSSLTTAVNEAEDYFGTIAEDNTILCQDIVTEKDKIEMKKLAEKNNVNVKLGQYSVTFYEDKDYKDTWNTMLKKDME